MNAIQADSLGSRAFNGLEPSTDSLPTPRRRRPVERRLLVGRREEPDRNCRHVEIADLRLLHAIGVGDDRELDERLVREGGAREAPRDFGEKAVEIPVDYDDKASRGV